MASDSRQAMESVVQFIGRATELKDPALAGHQKRVAKLAAAIAGELQLPPEQIDAIFFAGLIHDFGKVYLTSEVHDASGQSGVLELTPYKTHPEAGAALLEGMEFPWPIAAIIAQHHERMNGTGYPAGLKGKDILPEARILAVADVIETIGHRKQPPVSGLDQALSELEHNRGTLYDPAVVDAAAQLLREKSFTL